MCSWKSSYPRYKARVRTNLGVTLYRTGVKVTLLSLPGLWECRFATKWLLRRWIAPCSFFLAWFTQPQRTDFLRGGKSMRVHVWLLIKPESFSRIESIKLQMCLLLQILETHPCWSILALKRSSVDFLSLGSWGELRESSSVPGVWSKELEWDSYSILCKDREFDVPL